MKIDLKAHDPKTGFQVWTPWMELTDGWMMYFNVNLPGDRERFVVVQNDDPSTAREPTDDEWAGWQAAKKELGEYREKCERVKKEMTDDERDHNEHLTVRIGRQKKWHRLSMIEELVSRTGLPRAVAEEFVDEVSDDVAITHPLMYHRHIQGLTQSTLSAMTGITQPRIHEYETLKREPSVKNRKRNKIARLSRKNNRGK